MSNMSYCRWENTGRALQDCFHAYLDKDEEMQDMSEYETRGVLNVIDLAKELLEEIGYSVQTNDDVEKTLDNYRMQI